MKRILTRKDRKDIIYQIEYSMEDTLLPLKELNNIIQLSGLLWNYDISAAKILYREYFKQNKTANCKVGRKWRDAEKEQPELGEIVNFIVHHEGVIESLPGLYNREIYILLGEYVGNDLGFPEFSHKHVSYKGKYWSSVPLIPYHIRQVILAEKICKEDK